jgi:HEAT repeat protein
MAFYDLSKPERVKIVGQLSDDILSGIQNNILNKIISYFSDEDTYIRKAGYQAIGKIFIKHTDLQPGIIKLLKTLFNSENEKVRQSAINAAGEIGMKEFERVEWFFDQGLLDTHHSVRNAVIGSVKKMSEKNPEPVLKWAEQYLNHPDKEIRREVCHGIELRGRTHPQDILPLLKKLQDDKTSRVRNTLVHVLGQISYKKGCLEKVIAELNSWENKELTDDAIEEIINVHDRYKDFAVLTQQQAVDYISKHYKTGRKIK